MSCRCYLSLTLPHGVMDWSLVCDCGISWSNPLTFFLCLASSASLGNSTNPESLTTFESTNKAPDRIVSVFHGFRKCGTCRLFGIISHETDLLFFITVGYLVFQRSHVCGLCCYTCRYCNNYHCVTMIWYRTLCYTSLQFYMPVLKRTGRFIANYTMLLLHP